MKFEDIKNNDKIYLCAGENFYAKWSEYNNKTNYDWIGLWLDMNTNLKTQNLGLINSNNSADLYNIKCDITKGHKLNDNSVDIYQSEDVFEHIEYEKLEFIINDIYRILKPNGLLRLSIPDYNQKININRCLKKNNIIYFDPNGGGEYKNGKVINGGHVWFPTIDKVKHLLSNTKFKNINYLQYYDNKHIPHHSKINYSFGYIKRSPKFNKKHSLVIDCYK